MAKSKKHEEKGNREDPLRDSVRKKLARSPGPLGDMQKQTPEEIEKNRGILYDPAAADTCLKLIREKGFRLDQNACLAEDKILSDGP